MIGVDGDDTLWRNEDYFREAEAEFTRLMTRWAHGDHVTERLLDCERRNLRVFGYGVKGFVLSMIETAIELSDGEIPASDIHRLVTAGKDLLTRDHAVFDGADDALAGLSRTAPLVLITKGDLLHQESKVAASGLAEHFHSVHIVSEKTPQTYESILDGHDVEAERFVMIGNSVPSDVLPVLSIGGRALHVPYHDTWELERTDDHDGDFPVLDRLGDAVEVIEAWCAA